MAQPKELLLSESACVKKLISENIGIPGMVDILQKAIDLFIQAEVTEQTGADRYERSPDRKNSLNGKRKRLIPLQTGLGPVVVSIPRLRQGNFYPSVLSHYQRVDRALILTLQQAYVFGVSTRKMQRVFADIGLEHLDSSTVSRYIQELKGTVEIWRKQPLPERYIYIWVDALVCKIRENNIVRKQCLMVAIGLRKDGHREVLGVHHGKRESQQNWKDFFQYLKGRGLHQSSLWISDHHDGLMNALAECFPGQLHQRCIVHWERNAFAKVSDRDKPWLAGLLTPLIKAVDQSGFDSAAEHMLKEIGQRNNESLLNWIEETLPEIRTYLVFPESHWSKIKSTNPIERLNEEIRRRERTIRIFPTEDSCMMLVGMILLDQSEEWTSGRIYLSKDLEDAFHIEERMKRKLTEEEQKQSNKAA